MSDDAIEGESLPVLDDDIRMRGFVTELVLSENKLIADFAKHIVTVGFSAVGVILALKDKWLAGSPGTASTWLGIAIALLLIASLVSSIAIKPLRLRVSMDDYGEVESELSRIGRLRYRLTMAATASLLLAILIVCITVF
jgi:hypothetical protein